MPLTLLYVLDAFVLTHDEFEVFCWPLFSSVLLQQMASNRVIFQTWVAKPFGSPLGARLGGVLGGVFGQNSGSFRGLKRIKRALASIFSPLDPPKNPLETLQDSSECPSVALQGPKMAKITQNSPKCPPNRPYLAAFLDVNSRHTPCTVHICSSAFTRRCVGKKAQFKHSKDGPHAGAQRTTSSHITKKS